MTKDLLLEMYTNHPSLHHVWYWIYLNTNKNGFEYQVKPLCKKLKITRSKFYRALTLADELFAEHGLKVVNELPDENGNRNIKVEKLKPKKSRYSEKLVDDMFNVFVDHYKHSSFEYPTIHRHKMYITAIIEKIQFSMKNRNLEVNDESTVNSLQVFLEKLPNWWKSNNCTIKAINNNFENIINQIKSNNVKSSYQSAAESVGTIDYSKFTDQ